MIPRKIGNLINGSGKSVDTRPCGLLRAMARCMTVAQAAGVIAAEMVNHGCENKSVDVKEVQGILFEQGVYFGEDDRLKELGIKN